MPNFILLCLKEIDTKFQDFIIIWLKIFQEVLKIKEKIKVLNIYLILIKIFANA